MPMSIYKRPFERGASDGDVTHTVRRTAALEPPSPRKVDRAVAAELLSLRKAKPVNYMLPASIAWLKNLPSRARPMALAIQYPRIANIIALGWNNPSTCAAYFDDLLIDRRGGRQGFPADVHGDLIRLRDYYYERPLTLDE